MRLLPTQRIPSDLWSAGLLRIPTVLAVVYLDHLEKLGLKDRCLDEAAKDVHGGSTLQETHDHFAKRFVVSAGRVEFSVIGPSDLFVELSDALLSTFSDGHIALLDIPCGTGAMSASLISTLTVLREQELLPRLPLTISICAGDFSSEALSIFSSMTSALEPSALAQGIKINTVTKLWDATRSDQTASLVDRWFEMAEDANEFVVVVSNFSGALHNAGTFQDFSPCLEHVLSRLHDKKSTLLWIEPGTKSAKEGVLARILSFISKRVHWFSPAKESAETNLAEATYQIEHPLSRKQFPSAIAVHRFKRS